MSLNSQVAEIMGDIVKMRVLYEQACAQRDVARAEASMWKSQAESLQRQVEVLVSKVVAPGAPAEAT